MGRVIWVDSMKFIAIFLMVLAHANLSNDTMNILINAVHMPIFFFVSGLFMKKREMKVHLKKDLKALIQPYFLCSFIALSICWISPYLHPELYPGISQPLDSFKHAFIGIFVMDDYVTNYSFLPYGPLWFLIALFISRLIFQLLLQIKTRFTHYLLLIACICSVILFLFTKNIYFFSLDSAFMCFPFLVMGYFFNNYSWVEIIQRYKYLFCPLVGTFFYLLSIKNSFVNVDGGAFGNNIFLFYINALLGILFTISLIFCFNVERYKRINYLGANSLVILVTHFYILIPLKVLLTLLKIDISNLPVTISIFMTIFIVWISYYMAIGILKFIPHIVGKNQ